MDVYLIPTASAERYELYYEAPDEVHVDADASDGWLNSITFGLAGRLAKTFDGMLVEAEEWRRRRHEARPDRDGFLARTRRKVMSYIVERIAEQRLLWQLRKVDRVCARIPHDISEPAADGLIMSKLRQDVEHHRKWLWIDLVLLALSLPLVVIPGPNIPGFYFTFQVVSHYLSWTGAKRGLALAPWEFERCAELTELRAAMTMAAPQRQQCFREVAARLRLDHLPTFLDDVAARPA
jgi:hypothetical protein